MVVADSFLRSMTSVASTRYDFPLDERALSPTRQLLRPTCVPLIAMDILPCWSFSDSYVLQQGKTVNCFPPLSACIIFSGSMEATLEEEEGF